MATIRKSKSALIVVDAQEDFCTPHGSLAIEDARDLAPTINKLLNSAGFALKIATQDFHPADHVSFASQHEGAQAGQSSVSMENPDNAEERHLITLRPDHCVQGTPGAEIISQIDQDKFSSIVQKGRDRRLESLSGFGPPFRNPQVSMTDLSVTLANAGITDVFVVGVAFDGCVKATAIDAARLGYKTYIVREGTNASMRSIDKRATTLKELEEAGVSIVDDHSPLMRRMMQGDA